MDSRNRDTATTCDKNHPITHLHDELQLQLCDLKDLKYAYYAATHNRNVEPIIISNYPPSWVKSYKDNKSYLIDPIIKHGLREITPFSWHEALANSGPEGVDFFRRATRYRICSGTTFTLRDASGTFCALSVCDAGSQVDFDRRMAKQQSQLQMLLIKFHSWLMTSRTTDQLFSSAADGPLSTRELGVLQLVMRGKTYREIATDCGISERTVKFHMSNISGKLQVGNAKQAVYEAKRQGII